MSAYCPSGPPSRRAPRNASTLAELVDLSRKSIAQHAFPQVPKSGREQAAPAPQSTRTGLASAPAAKYRTCPRREVPHHSILHALCAASGLRDPGEIGDPVGLVARRPRAPTRHLHRPRRPLAQTTPPPGATYRADRCRLGSLCPIASRRCAGRSRGRRVVIGCAPAASAPCSCSATSGCRAGCRFRRRPPPGRFDPPEDPEAWRRRH